MKPLLSIGIPTYNRAALLDLCLSQIFKQILPHKDLIELIVSDNCSTDNTYEVVQNYFSKGFQFNYVKNETNKGPDRNILQAFELAQGKYVLIFSDDDVFFDGALDILIKILNGGDYGIIYINGSGFADHFYNRKIEEKKAKAFLYKNKKFFIYKVNFLFTFISSNVVNKQLIKDSHIDFQWFLNTHLVQLSYTYQALLKAKQNVFVVTPLIAVREDNTGGYNLYRVFGANLLKIHSYFVERGNDSKYFSIIENIQLASFFPYWINKFKTDDSKFINSTAYKELRPLFGKRVFFWLFTFPVIKLPVFISTILLVCYRVVKKSWLLLSDFIGIVTGKIQKVKFKF